MKQVIGYYNENEYRVEVDGEEVYQAGNSPYDSQGYTDKADGVGRKTMRSYCISTSKDMAKENDAEFIGVEFLEVS